MHAQLLDTPSLRAVGTLMILAFLLTAEAFTRPEYALGGFAICMNIVVMDRLACGDMCPEWDTNALSMAAVAARMLALIRASVQTRADPLPETLVAAVWCLLGLCCTWHARDKRGHERWLPWFLGAACLLVTVCTHAEFEPWWRHALRVGAFASLALTLHGRPLPPGSFAQRRGFLLCFGPLLLVPWELAWLFAVAAAWVQVWRELEEAPPGNSYELLAMA